MGSISGDNRFGESADRSARNGSWRHRRVHRNCCQRIGKHWRGCARSRRGADCDSCCIERRYSGSLCLQHLRRASQQDRRPAGERRLRTDRVDGQGGNDLMARRGRGRDRLALNAEINVVSLIDVMMLLMIIFMITAPMTQGGVDISLPKAQARPLESKSGLTVTIDRRGTIYVDDARLTLNQFIASFKALAQRRGSGGVYLRADDRVPYGSVVRVLAIMRASGVGDIGLVAEPPEGK